MAQTILRSTGVPNISSNRAPQGQNPGPATLAVAGEGRWIRVLVRNISVGVDVYLSTNAQELRQVPPGGNVFILPAGTSEVIPLAPKQHLYASAAGVNGQVCVAISDALPADILPAGSTDST